MYVVSSADVAVQVFRKLESEDLRVLQAIEAAMARHEFVPTKLIAKHSKFNLEEARFRLSRLSRFSLIRRKRDSYAGYTLNYAGYDCLAINGLVKAESLEAFGKPLGVGKEADVYDALDPRSQRIAVKFHRLGRISFRQTTRKRGYTTERTNWLFQSRSAAEREFRALRLVFRHGVAVPKPISRNRHVIVMGMIEGAELAECKKILKPRGILREILCNIRRAYQRAHVVHADLSEYNIILKPDVHILIIDWPQYVTRRHPNVDQLLSRDIGNILQFFKRKHTIDVEHRKVIAYVKGKGEMPISADLA